MNMFHIDFNYYNPAHIVSIEDRDDTCMITFVTGKWVEVGMPSIELASLISEVEKRAQAQVWVEALDQEDAAFDARLAAARASKI